MYPDLSYLFHALGAELDGRWSIFKTYGLCLMLAFLAAGQMLYRELKRREQAGQLCPETKSTVIKTGFRWSVAVIQGLYGFILFGKIGYLYQSSDMLAERAGYLLFSLDFDWILGSVGAFFALCLYYFSVREQENKAHKIDKKIYPSDRILTIVLLASFCGVLGARLLAIMEHPAAFVREPLKTLISTGGMSVYGGMILGLFVLGMYLWSKKIPVLVFLDAAVPGVFVAYGIGRLGCHFSGDGDWGIVSNPSAWYSALPDWLIAETFPHNVAQRGVELADCSAKYCRVLPEGVFPTSLYEFMFAIVLGALLWSWRKSLSRWPGVLFALYLIISGTERFFIEMIRLNDQYDFLGLSWSQAQHIAILYIICGSLLILYFRRKYMDFLASRPKIT